MSKRTIKEFAQEIAQEVSQLEEAKQEIIRIRDNLMGASYSELQACKRIASGINLDYRTIQKWLNEDGNLSSKNRLEVMLFLNVYKEINGELKTGETK